MVEQADAAERHRHAEAVAGLDDLFVADRAAGLGDVLHAALDGALDVVAEGEERVAAERNSLHAVEEPALLRGGKRLGLAGEALLPDPVADDVFVKL